MRGTASTMREAAGWTDDDRGRASDARRDAVRANARRGGRARRETDIDETTRDETTRDDARRRETTRDARLDTVRVTDDSVVSNEAEPGGRGGGGRVARVRAAGRGDDAREI
jgi:hypothetical protein